MQTPTQPATIYEDDLTAITDKTRDAYFETAMTGSASEREIEAALARRDARRKSQRMGVVIGTIGVVALVAWLVLRK